MECEKFLEKIDEFVRGELTHEELTVFENHLNTCVSCKKEARIHKVLINEINGLKVPDPGESYWKNSRQTIMETAHAPKTKSLSGFETIKGIFGLLSRKPAVALATTALLIIVLVSLLPSHKPDTQNMLVSIEDISLYEKDLTNDVNSQDIATLEQIYSQKIIENSINTPEVLNEMENYLNVNMGEPLYYTDLLENELGELNQNEFQKLIELTQKS